MAINLRSKPILIAGASSGIGAATARACAAAGMPVALAARRMDKLQAVAEDCKRHNVPTAVIECDVTDANACERMVDEAETELGPLHAAFANAGYGQDAPLLSMSDDQVRAMFETNLFGTLNVIRPAAERMKQRAAGHLLICSSSLAVFPTPWYGLYTATKAAQHHLGRALDIELRPFNIRCSTVHPIGTKTEFFDEMNRKQGKDAASSDAFMQTPERVAKAIVTCLRKPKPEVWTSAPARAVMLASGFAPRLTGFALRKAMGKGR